MLSDKEIDKFDRRVFETLLIKFRESKLSEIAVALTSVALVFIGAAQVIVAWKSYNDTTPLIGYAKDNTAAAQRFADNAEKINTGIANAVIELGTQATKLDNSAQQMKRLAQATEVANANAMQTDRPWIGSFIQVSDFETGKTPTFIVNFVNSGKRPARIDLTASQTNWYYSFPNNPDGDYTFDTTPSTSVIVPGQSSISILHGTRELKKEELDASLIPRQTFYVFAKVEYHDLKTGTPHWTHICTRFIPAMKNGTDNGFRDCTEYNNAN